MNLRDKMASTIPGELAIWISHFLYNHAHTLEEMEHSSDHCCGSSHVKRLHEIRAILEHLAIEELKVQSKEFVEENKWIFELEQREADEALVPQEAVAERKVEK